jgi:hypothetical protein
MRIVKKYIVAATKSVLLFGTIALMRRYVIVRTVGDSVHRVKCFIVCASIHNATSGV